jgi:hypothetical protein
MLTAWTLRRALPSCCVVNMWWSRDIDVKYNFVVQSDLLLTQAQFSRLLSKLTAFEVIFHISFPTPNIKCQLSLISLLLLILLHLPPSAVLSSRHTFLCTRPILCFTYRQTYTHLLTLCRVSGQWMEYGVLVGWYWQEKAEVLEEKPVPVPLCPLQIPHGRAWLLIRAWAVASTLIRNKV